MRGVRIVLVGAALAAGGAAWSADPARGAQLYMRTDTSTRSCVSCHGPDPGLSHNNILRAADSPETLTKVLNTVSAMGFLRAQLTEADKADIAAFLGTVSRLNDPASPLQLWPVTMDFGNLAPGNSSQPQFARLRNRSAAASLALPSLTATTAGLALTHDCPAALPPQGACDLRLQWGPQADGSLRGAVEIRTGGPAGAFQVAAAAQRAALPVSTLEWGSGTTALKFQGSSEAAAVRQGLQLHNPGPLPAVIGQPSITGPDAARFRVESGCAPGSVLQARTACEMVLSYSPSLKPLAEAVLQLRSDQANPPSVRLEGSATPPALRNEPVPLAANSGGGCSAGPPDRRLHDPTLALLALLAAAAALLRPGRRP
jgi:cytochrome c553